MLKYIETGEESRLFDPTVEKKWLKAKAEKLGVRLKVGREKVKDQVVPVVFRGELGALKNPAGWGKSLSGLLVFTKEEIDVSVQNVSRSTIGDSATKIKKHFERGKQLGNENFVDLLRFVVKEDNDCFYVKGLVAASLRQKDRWVSVSITKSSAAIEFCYCECEAGKSGTCSHAYAVLHMLAKWSLEQLNEVPDPVPATSQLCTWNVPQARGRVDKPKLTDLTFKSNYTKKRSKSSESNVRRKKRRSESTVNVSETSDSSSSDSDVDMHKESKGVTSNVYEARAITKRKFDGKEIDTLLSKISLGKNSDVPACNLFQSRVPYGFDLTPFGEVPVGSPLNYQCPFIEHGYSVYCSFIKASPQASNVLIPEVDYPHFPIYEIPNFTNKHLLKSVTDLKEKDILQKLEINPDKVTQVDSETREQYLTKDWGTERFYRFTASLHKDLKEKKTERGFRTLAKQCLEKRQNKATPNYYLKNKMEHGIFFEPQAIKVYTNHFKMIKHPLKYEKCGLVLNTDYYFMGASADGKVIDTALEGQKKFGILEVKCPEQYKEIDPKHAALVSDNFCLHLSLDGELRINKNHVYYDEVQHQLAMTGCHFCDFCGMYV